MSELLELLTNPAHWVFEAVSDLAFAVPAYLLGRWRLRLHDRRVHGAPAPEPDAHFEWAREHSRQMDELKA